MHDPFIEPLESRVLLTGVTLITHGWNGQLWGFVDTAAAAITKRLGGPAQAPQYVLTLAPLYSGGPLGTNLTHVAGTGTPQTSTSGEIIIKLDWTSVDADPNYSLAYIAGYVRDFFINSTVDGVRLAELPLRELSLSRGTGMIDEIARHLGRFGIWVDQETTCDPKPLTLAGDAPPRIYENVAFEDNYWRTDGQTDITKYSNGVPVNGAYNSNVYWLDSMWAGWPMAHIVPAGYYVGTIDLTATSVPGEGPIYPAWYNVPPDRPARDQTGFVYTSIVGGTRPSSGVWTASGGTGVRTATGTEGAQFPNVTDLTVTSGYSIFSGQTIDLRYIHQDRDDANTITFYLDTDRNPYNNPFAYTLGSRSLAQASAVTAENVSLSTNGVAPGTYWVCAKISDALGQVRYTYTPVNTPLTINGLKGEYFDNKDLTNLKFIRQDGTVNFSWSDFAPDPRLSYDTFSVRWTGQVLIPTSGAYTFYTSTDDGVRLWVNGVQLINKWQDQGGTEWSGTMTLLGGQLYDIKMEYYDNGWSAGASLKWSGPGIAKAIIPATNLFSAGAVLDTQPPGAPGTPILASKTSASVSIQWAAATDNVGVIQYQIFRDGNQVGTSSTTNYTDNSVSASTTYSYIVKAMDAAGNLSGPSGALPVTTDAPGTNGLKGEYYDNMDLTNLKITRTDAAVNFNWGDPGSPNPSIGPDTFSARWTGQVQAQFGEAYTFYTSTDDGVRLWVNGVQLINKWVDQGGTEWSGTIALAAGQKYDIKMEYYENAWGASAALKWSSASTPKNIIPAASLFPPTPAVPDTQPPSTPGSPTLVGKTSNSVSIQWAASTDNVGVTQYQILRNGVQVGTSTTTSYTDSGLAASTSYSYTVTATDAAGNPSLASGGLPVTTDAPGATVPGLKGEYFDNMDLTNLKITRTDAQVNFNWGDPGSPYPSIGPDTFSARWTGQVQAQFSETYTFYTSTDDGVRLWVNGVQLINKWVDQGGTEWSGTIALVAGQKYDIRMEYYENGWGALATLSWSSASTAKQIIPQAQLSTPSSAPDTQPPSTPGSPTLVSKTSNSVSIQWAASTDNVGVTQYQIFRDGGQVGTSATTSYTDVGLTASTAYSYTVKATDLAGNISAASGALPVTTDAPGIVVNGLKGEYFDNMDLTNLKLTRTDAAVNFNWGDPGSPDPSIGPDTFSVRWTGQVQAQFSETYTFYTSTDDGVRLWVNGVQLINKWQDQGGTEWSGTIALVAGQKYDIRMEYYENGWGALATLSWSSASQTRQIIPQAALFST